MPSKTTIKRLEKLLREKRGKRTLICEQNPETGFYDYNGKVYKDLETLRKDNEVCENDFMIIIDN